MVRIWIFGVLMEVLEGVKLIVVYELDGSKELVIVNVGDVRVILVCGG